MLSFLFKLYQSFDLYSKKFNKWGTSSEVSALFVLCVLSTLILYSIFFFVIIKVDFPEWFDEKFHKTSFISIVFGVFIFSILFWYKIMKIRTYVELSKLEARLYYWGAIFITFLFFVGLPFLAIRFG